ncbi:MAG: M48 family metallopeptidase [Synechococcaceae cyanobacterium]|nr:M48 family metallopeptidase [Synechococcaceae cyanobacterium]
MSGVAGGRRRLLAIGALLAGGAGLLLLLTLERARPPLPSSLAEPFRMLGVPFKLLDRLGSRSLPLGSGDERALGRELSQDLALQQARWQAQLKPEQRRRSRADQRYLDQLMVELRPFAHRPFPYRAFLLEPGGAANAMALPGGVILVTPELLAALGSEAELVSVLAHEIGHVELGHCFDAVRLRLLARRIERERLGQLSDALTALLSRHTYSKTAEHEADAYAFALLRESRYDPRGAAAAFRALARQQQNSGAEPRSSSRLADPLRDYLLSHPPLELRAAEAERRAAGWWRQQPHQRRYVGRLNLQQRQPLSRRAWAGEWVSAGAAPAGPAPHTPLPPPPASPPRG